jgi:SSS family solute:Na+ symporter
MANNGFMGYSWNVSKVAATKGMFDGITDAASMDSEMGLPIFYHFTDWVNGINAFIYFSTIYFHRRWLFNGCFGNIVTDIIAKFSKRVNS